MIVFRQDYPPTLYELRKGRQDEHDCLLTGSRDEHDCLLTGLPSYVLRATEGQAG